MDEGAGTSAQAAVPLTQEQTDAALTASVEYKERRGYPLTNYQDVLRRVVETNEGVGHVEREFAGVSSGHVAQVLRRQAAELDLPVSVSTMADLGVCIVPNPFRGTSLPGTGDDAFGGSDGATEAELDEEE